MLILGGSNEATALVRTLAGRTDLDACLSLAGRTRDPAPQPVAVRVGGFGGADGLAAHLRTEGVDLLVDATHPFAARMSANARSAAAQAGVPLVRAGRPPWQPVPGDDWREVADMAAAADALGVAPRRVFLTVGRLQLSAFAAAPQHHYLVRTIEPLPDDHGLADAVAITVRPPFDATAEARLMAGHRVDVLVTKNSGGDAAAAKLVAARALGLPVILVRRPAEAQGTVGVAQALAIIEAHACAHRGV